jgi:hypothetical protein
MLISVYKVKQADRLLRPFQKYLGNVETSVPPRILFKSVVAVVAVVVHLMMLSVTQTIQH